MYSRLSETAAVNYTHLKDALLKRYDYTKNGFRIRFRDGKPEEKESPEQFITRLRRYLTRWIEVSKTNKTYEGVSELFVRDQFINSCFEDLSIHLRERAPENLEGVAKIAEQFLIAHGRQLSTPNRPTKGKSTPRRMANPEIRWKTRLSKEYSVSTVKVIVIRLSSAEKQTNLIRELIDVVFYAIAQVILLRIANLSTIRRVLSKPEPPGIRLSRTQPRKTWDYNRVSKMTGCCL